MHEAPYDWLHIQDSEVLTVESQSSSGSYTVDNYPYVLFVLGSTQTVEVVSIINDHEFTPSYNQDNGQTTYKAHEYIHDHLYDYPGDHCIRSLVDTSDT